MQNTARKYITEEEIDRRYLNLPPEKKVLVRYGNGFLPIYNEDFLQGLTDDQLLNDCRDKWPKNWKYVEYREHNNVAIAQSRQKATNEWMFKETRLEKMKQKNTELSSEINAMQEKLKLLTQVKKEIDARPGQPIESYLESFPSDGVKKIIDCLHTSSDASPTSSAPKRKGTASLKHVSGISNQATNRLNDISSAPTNWKNDLLGYDCSRNEKDKPAKIVRRESPGNIQSTDYFFQRLNEPNSSVSALTLNTFTFNNLPLNDDYPADNESAKKMGESEKKIPSTKFWFGK